METFQAIKAINQCDNHTFMIEWADGVIQRYRLCDIQRCCPCANCTDEFTGMPLLDPNTVKDDVRAVKIKSIGKYGLQIQFTSGCSTGIYSFDQLRQMKGTIC
jgi:DUF971 family protein